MISLHQGQASVNTVLNRLDRPRLTRGVTGNVATLGRQYVLFPPVRHCEAYNFLTVPVAGGRIKEIDAGV